MPLLQRYILFELLRSFFFLLSVLTVLLVFVGVFREASANGLGPYQVAQILPYIVPSMLPFTVPAIMLLTVCLVYGRMAGDLEITAAKAAGISVVSLLTPAFLVGGLLTVSSFLLTDQVIPWAWDNIQRVVTGAMEQILLDRLRTDHQVNDPARGYSITVTGVDGRTLVKPTFNYLLHGHQPVTVVAAAATLDFDLERDMIILHLTKAMVIAGNGHRAEFEHDDLQFPLPPQIRRAKARHLSIREVSRRIAEVRYEAAKLERQRDWQAATLLAIGEFHRYHDQSFVNSDLQVDHRQRTVRKFETELHHRYAMSAGCFLFTLLGSPFAILQARRQFLASFIMCFLPILLVYYPITFLMMNLSKSGTVAAWWSAWVADGVVLVTAVCFLWLVRRN